MSRRAAFLILVCAVAVVAARRAADAQVGDPWAFFGPELAPTPAERRRLAGDEVVVRLLPARDGQLAVFAATALRASPETFLAWIQRIEVLKRSPMTPAMGRFSEPPIDADVKGMQLDPRDLEAIRDCTATDCALKLSVDEIARVRRLGPKASAADLQAEFRRVMLARLAQYRAAGLSSMPVAAGRAVPRPVSVFNALVAATPFLPRQLPSLASWLEGASGPPGGIESFSYWSQESYGGSRAAITLMQVAIVRPGDGRAPEVLVIGKQIFATRYLNGALTVTALVRDGDRRYLVYLYRSQLDLLTGMFGGLRRAVLQSRLRDSTPQLLRGLRARIEGGPPDQRAGAAEAPTVATSWPPTRRP